MTIESGQQLLHFRLDKQIGEGGMGVVWKALDTTLDSEIDDLLANPKRERLAPAGTEE